MNRRGMALLVVLWTVAAITVSASATMRAASVERRAALNRSALTRGRWAIEGCLALVQEQAVRSELRMDGSGGGLDSVDLGRGVWCRASVQSAGARLKLDLRAAPALSAIVGDAPRVAALLDWLDPDDATRLDGAERQWYQAAGRRSPRNGPAAALDELLEIRGFVPEVMASLRPYLTTHGDGRVDLNHAPREVLAALPGLKDAAGFLVDRRRAGRKFTDLQDLLRALPTGLRAEVMEHRGELAELLSFSSERLVIEFEGHVPGSPVIARTTIDALHRQARLLILAREEW